MKNNLQIGLLLSLFTLFSNQTLISQESILEEKQIDSIVDNDQENNDDFIDNDDQNYTTEKESIGHFISFYIDPSIIKDDNISIVTEKNQFYFKIKLENNNVIIFGKIEEESLTLYHITIPNNSSLEEMLSAFDTAEKAFLPLDDEIDCEKIEASINKETGELILFLPFLDRDNN